MRRRTRIVATLGPATDRPGVLDAVLKAGLDVARINFSHGAGEDTRRRIRQLRDAARNLGRPVAVLADLPGPKLRAVLAQPVPLEPGGEVSFTRGPSGEGTVSVTEPEIIAQVKPGHRVLLDDGRLQLQTLRCDGERFTARVLVGGTLLPGKGINLPDTPLSIPTITERDRQALAVCAEAGVDWLALSFVRGPEAAVELIRAALDVNLRVPILAKIERPEGVERAADILKAFDAIMVARGDLGVEIPLERVPHVQKRLIQQARAAGKPVITATDMLDSMRMNPRPTRAEASDVANAICDGTDAVMLSGETAAGEYPVEAVAAMDRIAVEAERHWLAAGHHELEVVHGVIEDEITHATCSLAREVKADAIVTPTLSGHTAMLVARHRPRAAIVAPVPDEAVLRQLALVWGLLPVPLPTLPAGADRLQAAVQAGFERGALRAGQLVVLLAGHPVEGGDRSPTIRVVRIGEGGRSVAP